MDRPCPNEVQRTTSHMVREEKGDWWYADGIRLLSQSAGVNPGVRFENPDLIRRECFFEEARQGGYIPSEKIKDMDLDGVYGEVVYPSLALVFWRHQDSDYLSELFRVYNDWIAEFCKAVPNRIKGAAVLNVDDVSNAVSEMTRAAKMGLVTAMITVYPPERVSYRSRIYDPLWAAAQDLGMSISLHIGTNRETPPGADHDKLNPLKALTTYSLRSTAAHWVSMSIANMIFAGIFDRYPKLKVISVEHELAWAAHLLNSMDSVYKLGRREGGYRFKDQALPSDFFHQNVFLSFQEDKDGARVARPYRR